MSALVQVPRDILLLVRTDTAWHRGILQGIAHFAADHANWHFTVVDVNAGQNLIPSRWCGDGIICRVTSDELANQILESGVPAVNVSWLQHGRDHVDNVVSKEQSCAKLAFHCFSDRRFTRIGYIGAPPWLNYGDEIPRTIAELGEEHGIDIHHFPLTLSFRDSFGINTSRLSHWLSEIEKPFAVVTWTSRVGQLLTKVAQDQGLAIPNDLAILCIEHDPLWSSLAPVPLSFIDQDPWRVGYMAAKQLAARLAGKAVDDSMFVEPIAVVERRSTAISATNCEVVRRAISFIYSKAESGIHVDDVVHEVGVSRRTLEAKFKQELSTSPAVFLKKIQLQRVAQLLRSTKLSVTEIARESGFVYPEVLIRSFKKKYGMTPMQFRGAGV